MITKFCMEYDMKKNTIKVKNLSIIIYIIKKPNFLQKKFIEEYSFH